MPTYFRRDDWVTSAQGDAISGAGVYVTSQPTIPGHTDTNGSYVPPSPLIQVYADSNGITPLAQPVITDGFGHSVLYATPGIYGVTYYSPQIGQTTLADQVISALVSQVNAAPPIGTIDGTNVTFHLASSPVNYSMLYLNGVFQVPGTDYSIVANIITMTVAPSEGDQLFAVWN